MQPPGGISKPLTRRGSLFVPRGTEQLWEVPCAQGSLTVGSPALVSRSPTKSGRSCFQLSPCGFDSATWTHRARTGKEKQTSILAGRYRQHSYFRNADSLLCRFAEGTECRQVCDCLLLQTRKKSGSFIPTQRQTAVMKQASNFRILPSNCPTENVKILLS